jgi:DNA-binding XRE family transcriptional regulator
MPVAPHNFDLVGLRKILGLTQSEMAKRVGLSLRTYQELEMNSGKVRRRHVRLAESVAFDVAVEKNNPMLAPASVRKKALKLASIILDGCSTIAR